MPNCRAAIRWLHSSCSSRASFFLSFSDKFSGKPGDVFFGFFAFLNLPPEGTEPEIVDWRQNDGGKNHRIDQGVLPQMETGQEIVEVGDEKIRHEDGCDQEKKKQGRRTTGNPIPG